jgi:hypothetical protein
MDILKNRINRRTLGGITVGAAATTGLAYLVSAQDATPDAGLLTEATPVGVPALAELESANQVDVVANKNSYALFVSGENQPGWYVFNVENASEADASFNLAKLPEDVAVGDFTSAIFGLVSGNSTERPEWFGDVEFVGGTYVPVGGTNSVLVNLDAGEWIAFSAHKGSTQGATTIQVLSAEETVAMGSEPVATPEGGEVAPEGFGSTFTISVTDNSIGADSLPSAGQNIVGVRNDGTSPATLVLAYSAEAVDPAAAADVAKSWIAGEEVPVTLVGGMGVLSPGEYGYFEMTAEAGTYVAFSSLLNAEGGSQVDDGAIIVVPVS